MERKQLKEILFRFYKGECTDSEEQLLRYYFLSDSVDEEFKADQQLFKALHDEKNSVSQDFSFDKLIDSAIKNDPSYIPQKKNPFLASPVFRMAAAIILLIVCGSIFYLALNQGAHRKLSADTYSDPKIAYVEAKKALEFVSVKMNHGTEKLQKLETFNEGMDRMNTLSIINLLPRN